MAEDDEAISPVTGKPLSDAQKDQLRAVIHRKETPPPPDPEDDEWSDQRDSIHLLKLCKENHTVFDVTVTIDSHINEVKLTRPESQNPLAIMNTYSKM